MEEAAIPALPAEERREALEAVTQLHDASLVPWLQKNFSDDAVREGTIRALAAYDDPKTPTLILNNFDTLKSPEKSEAVNTLASRANYAVALLNAVKDGKVAPREITPFVARQMQAYKDPKIDHLLKELGSVRPVSGDKAAQVARYKALLTPEALAKADRSNGRAVFQKTCAACHSLFGEGGKLAPELTGAQRGNIDYLLENILDPSALVWDRYKATYFDTKDDRLISGIVQQENDSTITILTTTGSITLPLGEITKRTQSDLSLMPEGLLNSLNEKEVLDLIAYLQSPSQVPALSNP
jgi:putative heme-binding domain-containing protein